MASYVPEYLSNFVEELDEHPWIFASLASMLVGLSGILPLFIIPLDSSATFEDGPGAATLRILLSFAVGGLLGDVFLHLLPEAWENDMANTKAGQHVSLKSGLWCLFGMLVFIVVEKLFSVDEHNDGEEEEEKQNGAIKQIEIEEIEKLLEIERKHRGVDKGICNGTVTAKQIYDSCIFNNNTKGEGGCCSMPTSNAGASGRCKGSSRWMGRCLLREAREKALRASKEKTEKKDVAGYLNLMANSIDNFTHGLAVGGSFLVGFRVGVLTTFAILVHEIPHEVGDFAILLKSGFSRWEAAKAQLATATAGLVGAMTAVVFSGASNSLEAKTSWIVPFTAGGFLHIALVTVLPDLLREHSKLESLKHFAALALGILLMHTLTTYFG
ncbi:zinc transporter ZIP13 homolog [Bombyx mandarina]|uniref:Zinc transporter ZIP13 homolog n=2 Tax=Bombyx TaxID=7090 RepID=A0A8R1WHQ2_BOMMO|nr:zinc transporter ZIP13 homolog [Bombyx mori]XP_028043598.1 zinc transporter ZIP13 homolog [Bombyx mandarina]